MRECPACRRGWPDEHAVCPSCLAALVADADATITCRHCGAVCPTRMHTCTSCFALLRAEDVDLGPALARAVVDGRPLPRPVGRPPFADGPTGTVERAGGAGALVVRGEAGFVEARIGPGRAALPPLTCEGDTGPLFRLLDYAAAERAVVAVGPDGAALATFLRTGGVLDRGLAIRDETSAPVARLEVDDDCPDWSFRVVETGGGVVGHLREVDVWEDGWEDDRWTVEPRHADGHPLRPMAWVALALAAKVLLGRPVPTRVVDLVDVFDLIDRARPMRLVEQLDRDR